MNSEDEYKTHIPTISFSHNQTDYLIRTKHTVKTPNFFEKDKISNDYISYHIKRCYLYLIKSDFKLIFNNGFSIYIETDFYHNTMLINSKRYLLDRIEGFREKGYIFSHIDEKNNSTVNCKMYMTYEIYNEHPMQAIELKANIIFA